MTWRGLLHITLMFLSFQTLPVHSLVPIHIVTSASQLPAEFLEPSSERQLIIGFDCDGVDLCRHLDHAGISYQEKEEVLVLLRQDPKFWTYRPLTELMLRAVRGVLYCQCFCINNNDYADWPSLPTVADYLIVKGDAPEEEILSILDVPPGKMERVIGRRGSSILAMKESYNAEILIGGAKGPPDKVFIIGPVKQVRKAEAMLRGRMQEMY